MSKAIQKELIYNLQAVGLRALTLSDRVIGSSLLLSFDYLSVFTQAQLEYDELCVAAASLGAKVYEKKGNVYVANKETAKLLPSKVFRVSQPADTELLGCADLVATSFATAREKLVSADYPETVKVLEGHEYTIIEVTDAKLGISVYLPSEPMTKIMGIAN